MMPSLSRQTLIRVGFVCFTLIAILGVGKATFFSPRQIHAAAPRGFATRGGSHLRMKSPKPTAKTLNATAASSLPFRFSGANMEWFGHDAFTGDTAFSEADGLGTENEMGGTVARSLWLTSIGTAGSLQPSLGNFDSDAFAKTDAAIKRAGDYGIQLIIPLVDGNPNGDGAYTYYTQWEGKDASAFFTDPQLIGDFENFISTYLNHVNVYTGVANKDNPTILAWEPINEISAPASWTQTICDFIKGIDGNHLVGTSPVANQINNDDLGVGSVDFVDDHFYPMSVSNLNSHAATVTGAGKAYIAGEYDWSNFTGGDSLGSFLSAVEGNGNVSGDLFWEIFPHLSTYGFAQYNAGAFGNALGLHYPGDSLDMRARVQQLRNHAYAMRGQGVPGHNVPAAPIITSIAGSLIYWSGVAADDNYSIERSVGGSDGPWDLICDHCVNDNNAPYTDGSQPSGTVWYRIRAFNLDVTPSDYSAVYQVGG